MAENAVDEGLGSRIRKARNRADLTQSQLAQSLGVDRKTVDNWENGRTRPRSHLVKLQDLLAPFGFADETGDDAKSSPEQAKYAQPDVVTTAPTPTASANGVIEMIMEVLGSPFAPRVQVQMIEDIIEREYLTAQSNSRPQKGDEQGQSRTNVRMMRKSGETG